MKALVYEGVKTLNYRAVPDPAPKPGQHLVKVQAVGICGSDMHGYLGHDPRRVAPLILGHEAAGVITGGDRDGERVTVNPLIPCGTCAYCTNGRENICPQRSLISIPPNEGAFAEYVAMPGENLVTVPQDVPIAKAALAEPMAVSWHTAKLALAALHPTMDRKALVIGGGAIGLTSALCLRAMGITDITIAEPHDGRRAFLTEHCGEQVVAQAQGQFPLIIDAVGYAATRAVSSELAAHGGVIAHVGLGGGEPALDVRRMTLQEITFIGTYCYTKQDFQEAAQAIFDGRLGALDWAQDRALAEGAGAFADLYDGRVNAPKIVLHP